VAEIEMHINSIRRGLVGELWAIILEDRAEMRYLPVWIGPAESDAIAIALQETEVPRPLTHDMVCKVIEAFGGKVAKVVIDGLTGETYEATLVIAAGDKALEIDCRPSDAIGVAVRAGAPILVEEDVLEKAGIKLDDMNERYGECNA